MKEISDKLKEEIVNSQIQKIKEKYASDEINYEKIRECLLDGINKSNKEEEKIEEIDLILMRKIEKTLGSMVGVRLINSARYYFKIEYPNNPNDKQLLELYSAAKNDLIRNETYFSIKNYGRGTHRLLGMYLKEKGII